MPDPDDEADRLENSGGLLEQRGGLTRLIEPAKLDTEMCGSQKVGLGRTRRSHRVAAARTPATATSVPAAAASAPLPTGGGKEN